MEVMLSAPKPGRAVVGEERSGVSFSTNSEVHAEGAAAATDRLDSPPENAQLDQHRTIPARVLRRLAMLIPLANAEPALIQHL